MSAEEWQGTAGAEEGRIQSGQCWGRRRFWAEWGNERSHTLTAQACVWLMWQTENFL